MKIDIGRYIIIITVLIISSIMLVAYNFFSDQRSKSTELLVNELRKELSETAHSLSTKLTSREDVGLYESELIRKAIKNSYISAILITDEQDILLSTDHQYKVIPPSKDVCSDLRDNEKLSQLDCMFLRQSITYYEGTEKKKLYIYLGINHGMVSEYLDTALHKAILTFAAVSILLSIILFYLHHRFLIRPLERLRQYAYYQSKIPSVFPIRELEYIRSSMIQTFKRLEQERLELYNLARTDQLSGLANRNALLERANWIIAESSRQQKDFALLFLDLDHFKDVNDSLGHRVGDELLKNISSYLQEILRAEDFVARIGGDEFVIIINHYSSHFELIHIIDRILARVKEPFLLENNPVYISGSVGVVLYPKDGSDIHTLLKHADIAMYEAKRKGRDQYHFFTDSLNQKVQEDIQIDKELRNAINDNQLELYYQPKVDTYTGKIIGSEALIRWNHPTKGLIYPDKFISIAEQSGLIVPMGDWIIRTAMKQQQEWEKGGICDYPISVNLSAKQFHNENFLKSFDMICNEVECNTEKLEIEITESLFLENNDRNLVVIQALQNRGVKILLDDFGTGYSSLFYLKKFPINILKIDKSFMDDFHSLEGSIFIKVIVTMAKTLGMGVIAEGIEDKNQVDFLQSIGCESYQGYYCAKPLKASDFAALVISQKLNNAK